MQKSISKASQQLMIKAAHIERKKGCTYQNMVKRTSASNEKKDDFAPIKG